MLVPGRKTRIQRQDFESLVERLAQRVRGVEDLPLTDGLTRPIVVAHLIKTTAAAFDEHAHTGDPTPLLALARFAASPVRERWLRRRALEAIRLLEHGKVPRTLT